MRIASAIDQVVVGRDNAALTEATAVDFLVAAVHAREPRTVHDYVADSFRNTIVAASRCRAAGMHAAGTDSHVANIGRCKRFARVDTLGAKRHVRRVDGAIVFEATRLRAELRRQIVGALSRYKGADAFGRFRHTRAGFGLLVAAVTG